MTALSVMIGWFSVMLLLGISFVVTFMLTSMMIDLVRASAKPASFLDVGLFISFFPQLIGGFNFADKANDACRT